MSFCVGITGNIGTGKSTAIETLQTLGVSIISADAIAKALTKKGQQAYCLIKDFFGSDILLPNGELDRKKLRQRIFAKVDDRLKLESILHPLIREDIKKRITSNTTPYCAIEIPLLYRKADFPYLNRIVLLDLDPEIQVERVMLRDNCSEAVALAIIQTQKNERKGLDIVDDLVMNNGTIEDLVKKITVLHKTYLDLAKAASG